MKREFDLIFDVLFYFILPIILWEFGRAIFSDYICIFIAAVPGITYSFYRFFASNGTSFSRMYLFVNIIIGLVIDLCSRSALMVLWNNAFYSIGLFLLYFASCFTKKPLYFYFTLDILIIQGYDKKITEEFFNQKEARRIFRIISMIKSVCELVYALLLMKLLKVYGVEIYTFSVIVDQLLSFVTSGVYIICFYYLYRFMNEMVTINNFISRKHIFHLPKHLYSSLIENCYLFMRKHFI